MNLIDALGLDIKILIAQFVNFGILLFVLGWFFYKPILKFLDERSEKIKSGVLKFEEAERKLITIEAKEKKILAQASKEASNIIQEAYLKLDKQKEGIIEETRQAVLKIKEEGKNELENQKKKIIREIKEEAGDLVVVATKKVLDIKTSVDKKIVSQVLSEI
ncbi:MAG: ATP synthase F0 subunit B [Candidatus Liptonbacteria bacterium CG11_big_fil_rev_8_21_14_0_20_35_14]|uniref:ATP synthase subunit b n=1 Tax=Candidatus Liptonbacteria bacterium CG11_big_fil_rev_8_21_14_0_20_35_14 TaxID=1974634 RepID=A0A2H0N9Q5_9BACT|nr:MAG: ATP synthase F0 subunit B [Candidatus Liptonbacteria bacterium CG11_big_fil_rev_8_21_14_0_20_35_14]